MAGQSLQPAQTFALNKANSTVTPPAPGTFAQRLGRAIRYFVVLPGAGLLTMALSYHAALWYLRGHDSFFPSAMTDTNEVEELQGFSKELTGLMREYLDRASRAGAPSDDTFVRWAKESFRPRVNELRRRLQASASSSEALNALLSASDRVSAMAGQPDVFNLRQRATDDVLEAVTAVENRVSVLESGHRAP